MDENIGAFLFHAGLLKKIIQDLNIWQTSDPGLGRVFITGLVRLQILAEQAVHQQLLYLQASLYKLQGYF